LDTYFVREGIKRKNEKASDLEKIVRVEYTLDWSQSKAFVVDHNIRLFQILDL